MADMTQATVPGRTTLGTDPVNKITDEILATLRNQSKPEEKRLEAACTKIMDLYLEGKRDKYNAVLAKVSNALDGSTWDKLYDNYLSPSNKMLDCIGGAGLVAEKFDLSVAAQSVSNLNRLGMRVSENDDGTLSLSFGSNVRGDLGGREIDFGGQKLRLDDNTKGVELRENNGGFDLVIHNIVGEPDRLGLKLPQTGLTERPEFIPGKPNYTPGTRYAVVSRDDIDYQKLS
jgi:hypothetical protein